MFLKLFPLQAWLQVYSILYSDCPWYYNARNNKDTKFGLGARRYPVMKTKDIAALPIKNIAADNCALFLWATFPRLPDALIVMEAWGFDYKTVAFNWIKLNPRRYREGNIYGIPYLPSPDDTLEYLTFFGTGHYTKSNAEICLLGIKGRMEVKSNKVSSIIHHPRMQHSKKPPIVRDKIVKLFGDLPRVELFARDTVDGWDSIGLDIDGQDIREVLC